MNGGLHLVLPISLVQKILSSCRVCLLCTCQKCGFVDLDAILIILFVQFQVIILKKSLNVPTKEIIIIILIKGEMQKLYNSYEAVLSQSLLFLSLRNFRHLFKKCVYASILDTAVEVNRGHGQWLPVFSVHLILRHTL